MWRRGTSIIVFIGLHHPVAVFLLAAIGSLGQRFLLKACNYGGAPLMFRRGDRKRLNTGCVLSAVSLCSQRGRKRTCVPTVLFELLAQVTLYSSWCVMAGLPGEQLSVL